MAWFSRALKAMSMFEKTRGHLNTPIERADQHFTRNYEDNIKRRCKKGEALHSIISSMFADAIRQSAPYIEGYIGSIGFVLQPLLELNETDRELTSFYAKGVFSSLYHHEKRLLFYSLYSDDPCHEFRSAACRLDFFGNIPDSCLMDPNHRRDYERMREGISSIP